MNRESEFRNWLKKYPYHKYQEITINTYIKVLKNGISWFNVEDMPNIFDVETKEDVENYISMLKKSKDYKIINYEHGHGSFNAALTLYQKYLNDTFNHDNDAYGKESFLAEVFMSEEEYEKLKRLLLKKKNIILQGAPGVGKTYIAKRLANSVMQKIDPNRVEMIQFHQSYSYEDFIEGYRPTEEGFCIKKGTFYNFCKRAAKDGDQAYFFIIDEINRGNLSKIFGELFMLIEADKRGDELKLLYSDDVFFVPENVYIIGMMNTADRSLAMIDYALRRRFSFFEIKPGFETRGFKKYQRQLNNEKFDRLIDRIKDINQNVISKDLSLGEGFCIGHSYFCDFDPSDELDLDAIINYDILPLFQEYWFDDVKKFSDCKDRLESAIK